MTHIATILDSCPLWLSFIIIVLIYTLLSYLVVFLQERGSKGRRSY